MAGLLTAERDAVAAEIVRWSREPFDLATANCAVSVAGYVARAKGLPLPLWINAFGRRGASLLMRRDAAFMAVATRAMAQLDCAATERPVRGDVGLIDLADSGLTACICAAAENGSKAALWAARGDGEAVITTGAMIRAWRVECRRP